MFTRCTQSLYTPSLSIYNRYMCSPVRSMFNLSPYTCSHALCMSSLRPFTCSQYRFIIKVRRFITRTRRAMGITAGATMCRHLVLVTGLVFQVSAVRRFITSAKHQNLNCALCRVKKAHSMQAFSRFAVPARAALSSAHPWLHFKNWAARTHSLTPKVLTPACPGCLLCRAW